MGGTLSEKDRKIKLVDTIITNCQEEHFKQINDEQYFLFLFHHIHHLLNMSTNILEDDHKVHHCGKTNNETSYDIGHCKCGKHYCSHNIVPCLSRDDNGKTVILIIELQERCKHRGYHIESGKIIDRLLKNDKRLIFNDKKSK